MSAVRGVLGVTHLVAQPNATSSFSGVKTTNTAGGTEHFEVFYDRTLGESGRAAGAVVLNRAERDLSTIRGWLNARPDSERFVVVLGRMCEDARTYREPGSSDTRTALFCDVQTTPRLEALQSCFFVAFQLADLCAAAAGWDAEIGGPLARVLATALYPRRIAGFNTAWLWMEGDREDPVSDPVPQGAVATGGAVLFLNYLHYQLGYSWQQIATNPAPTLGEAAQRLTGSDECLTEFRSLLAKHYPVGQPLPFFPDNPFPLADEPAPRGIDGPGTPAPSEQRTGRTRSDRRVCLLTGASGTLGSELCNRLADRYDFAAVCHSHAVSSDAFAVEADLTEEGACERIVEMALSQFGRIDLIVNAAVASTWGPMLESAPLLNSAPRQFLMNAVVPLQVACAAAHLSWQDRIGENRAVNRNVINVSSISGQNLFSGEGQSVYAASKAALDHLTGHMALEFAAIGVRVNAVAPNSFPTHVPISRVVRAIEELDDGDTTGTIVVVDGEADHVIELFA